MMFCFWCQTGNVPKNLQNKGFVWIHLDCLMEINDFRQDTKAIQEIIKGKRNESIENYLERMQEFDRKWNNSMKLIKQLEQKN